MMLKAESCCLCGELPTVGIGYSDDGWNCVHLCTAEHKIIEHYGFRSEMLAIASWNLINQARRLAIVAPAARSAVG